MRFNPFFFFVLEFYELVTKRVLTICATRAIMRASIRKGEQKDEERIRIDR